MKTRSFAIFLLIIVCGNSAYSQEKFESFKLKKGFSISPSYLQVKDKSLNGLVHSGPGLQAGLFLEGECCNYFQELEMNVGMHFLKSRFEDEAASYFLHSTVQYRLSRQVLKAEGNTRLYLGGQVKLDASQGIYTGWDENHFNWLTAHTLGFSGQIYHTFDNNNSLSLSLGLPLLSVVSRNPEKQMFHESEPTLSYIMRTVHQDMNLSFATEHFNPELKLAYHFKIGKTARACIFWQFNYTHNSLKSSKDLSIINQVIGIGFEF